MSRQNESDPDTKASVVDHLRGGDFEPGQRWLRPAVTILLSVTPILAFVRFGGFEIDSAFKFALRGAFIVAAGFVVVQQFVARRTDGGRDLEKRRIRNLIVFTSFALGSCALAAWSQGSGAGEGVLAAWLLMIGVQRVFSRIMSSKLISGKPAWVLVGSFGSICLIGSLILTFAPRSVAGSGEINWVDALFTATSATCVTGLETVSTGGTFSLWGQGFVLLLIQIGGLGIMTFGTFILLTAGHRFGLSDRALVKETLNVEGVGKLSRLVIAILVLTLGIELVGALLLRPWFAGADQPIFAAVFHSVSAFCNAGFSLQADSFQGFAGDWRFNLAVSVLIVFGGLGFSVLVELGRRGASVFRRSIPRRNLSLHSRLVLISSLALLILVSVIFAGLEWNGSLAGRSFSERACISGFQSVSSRTAGFSSVEFAGGAEAGGLRESTKFAMIPFMLIGASPGSTGGGMKTVTFVILVLAIVAVFRNRPRVEVQGRRLPDDIVRRASAIAMVYVLTLFVACLALLVSDGERFTSGDLIFEAVSAVATVGFSCGVSSSADLSQFGKLVLIGLMFAGRVGPWTLVLMTASRDRVPVSVEYPEERVMIG